MFKTVTTPGRCAYFTSLESCTTLQSRAPQEERFSDNELRSAARGGRWEPRRYAVDPGFGSKEGDA